MIAKKSLRNHTILPACFILCSLSSLPGDQGTLAELYRSGKARLVPELVIDANSLPKDALFVGLTSISSDSEGNIYVLDASDNNIKKFDAAGKLTKIIGRKGQGPGEFSLPADLTVAGDRLVVYDMANWRLSLLTLDGALIKNVPLYNTDERPIKIRGFQGGGVILDTEKTYYEIQDKPQDRRISILDRDLKPINEIYFAAVLRTINLIVPSKSIRVVFRPFCADIHWDVSPEGNILVGLAEKYEVSIFNADKQRIGTIARAWNPIKVTDEDKKKWSEGVADDIVNVMRFPRFKPAFDEVIWDPDGNILIHPILKEGQSLFYDAFTSKGKFIARVELTGSPQNFYRQPKQVSGGFIWACETDADGDYRVVKWRLSKF